MVCSIEDGAIAEVISAIDQLAADSGAGLTGADLRSRIAGVWAMLAALDPELARLSAAYGQGGQDHEADRTAPRSAAPHAAPTAPARGTPRHAVKNRPRARGETRARGRLQVTQAATTSMPMVAVTSGCSRTLTW